MTLGLKLFCCSKMCKTRRRSNLFPKFRKIPEAQDLDPTVAVSKHELKRFKKENGEYVFYAMSVPDYENLALDIAELRRYIEQQKEIIIYYEKAVTDEKNSKIP